MIAAMTRQDIRKQELTAANPLVFLPLLLCVLYSMISQYYYLCFLGGISLTIIFYLFWKPLIPPVLLYYFGFSWLQVFGAVFYADYMGQTMDELYLTTNATFMIGMTLLQVVLMSIAAYFSFGSLRFDSYWPLLRAAAKLDTRKVLIAYVISSMIFPVLLSATHSNPSLYQLIQAVGVVRQAILILMAFLLLLKKEYRGLLIGIFLVEFLLSFVSYFSSFKDVILYFILVYLTLVPRLRFSLFIKLSPMVVLLGFLFIFWSYVKPMYRDFLNGGSGQQVVTVGKGDALGFLARQVQDFDKKSFNEGVEIFLQRVQAMAYYLEVANRVPKVIPHEQGKVLSSSAEFVLVPRFLKANKGVLDPSAKLSYYAGRPFKTASEGTSIAMGYFGDLYVDYGVYGMILPLIILGFFIGWGMSRFLKPGKYNLLFSYALMIGFILNLGFIESDIIFYLGALRNLIAVFIIGNWVIFPWINRFLEKKES